MNSWKQALWLAKFELRKSKMAIFSFLFIVGAASGFFVTTFAEYLDIGFVAFDIFFLIAFSVAPVWMKPKEFQFQKMGEEAWGSPLFNMLSQLPIKKEVLVNSRFVIYFTYAIPYHILLLIATYLLSDDIRTIMSIPAYIAFSIIWICFGIYIGGVFPASDAGDHISLSKSIIYSLILFIVGALGLAAFHFLYGGGIVAWTVMLANEWPIVAAAVSIIASVLSLRSYKQYMYKQMAKLDYFK